MRGVDAVAVRVERGPRGVESLGRKAQVARDKRDFGFGDDAPRPSNGFFRTERPRSPSKEALGAHEIAKLRHREAPERECRRIGSEGDAFQRAERVARR